MDSSDKERAARELAKALDEANNHLDYCGWGDSWEREGATAAKLPEKVEAALITAKRLGWITGE